MFQMKILDQIFNREKINATLKKLRNNRHFKYGVPFVIFVVGAPTVLKHLMSVSISTLSYRLYHHFKEKTNLLQF